MHSETTLSCNKKIQRVQKICGSAGWYLLFTVVLSVLLGVTACGGSNSTSTQTPPAVGLATPAPASRSNSYYGVQSPSDIWQASINHVTNVFSAQDLTNASITAATGAVTIQNPTEFLSFALTDVLPQFQQYGYGLEIAGRVLLLRPGNSTTALAAMVPSTCVTIQGNVTFQFVTLVDQSWAASTATAYGSVQVGVSSNTWNFSNFSQYTLSSTSQAAVMLASGSCGSTAGSSSVMIPAPGGYITAPSIIVGPSGFLVANQLLTDPSTGSQFGAVGMIQPSASIDTGSVATAAYYGFVYEPSVTPGCVGSTCVAPTQMVTFSNATCPSGVKPSGTGICGAVYQQDVLSGPQQDLLLDLGSQDQMQFGLYKNVSLQIPDPNKICGTTGSCTLSGVAVVGNPEGKFAIFFVAQDKVNNSPMLICLLQQ